MQTTMCTYRRLEEEEEGGGGGGGGGGRVYSESYLTRARRDFMRRAIDLSPYDTRDALINIAVCV
jgi:hypothetical protein